MRPGRQALEQIDSTDSAVGRNSTVLLLLAGIFLVGLAMRVIMVDKTEVDSSLRGDAVQNYFYAVNLKNYGI